MMTPPAALPAPAPCPPPPLRRPAARPAGSDDLAKVDRFVASFLGLPDLCDRGDCRARGRCLDVGAACLDTHAEAAGRRYRGWLLTRSVRQPRTSVSPGANATDAR